MKQFDKIINIRYMEYSVIIVAAGKATRSNLGYNKNFYLFDDGETLIAKTMKIFLEDNECKEIIVVLDEDNINKIKENERIKKVIGGSTRHKSVFNGLKEVTYPYVMIHDGARPYLRKESLNKLKEALKKEDAVILVNKVIDTVKYVEDDFIKETINRNNIYLAQTPQAFKTSLIYEAYQNLDDKEYTDEAMVLETKGYKVKIIINEYDNPKFTLPEDFK